MNNFYIDTLFKIKGLTYEKACDIIISYIEEKYNISCLDIALFIDELLRIKYDYWDEEKYDENKDIFEINVNNINLNKIINLRKELLPIFIENYINNNQLNNFKYVNVMFLEKAIFEKINNNHFYLYYYKNDIETFIANLLMPAMISNLYFYDEKIYYDDCIYYKRIDSQLVVVYCINHNNEPIIISNSIVINDFIRNNMREINSAHDFYIEYNYLHHSDNCNQNIYPLFQMKDNIITYSKIFDKNFDSFNFYYMKATTLFKNKNYKLYVDRFI